MSAFAQIVYGAWLICICIVMAWILADMADLKSDISAMQDEIDALMREDDDMK